jgi:serine protease
MLVALSAFPAGGCGDDSKPDRHSDAMLLDAGDAASVTPVDARSMRLSDASGHVEPMAADAASGAEADGMAEQPRDASDEAPLDASTGLDASRPLGDADPAPKEASQATLETDAATSREAAVLPSRLAGRFVVKPEHQLDVDIDPNGTSTLHNDEMHPVLEDREHSQPLSNPAWVVGYLGPMPGKSVEPISDAGFATTDAMGVVSDASPEAGWDGGRDAAYDAATPHSPSLKGPLAAGNFDGDNLDYYRVDLDRGDVVTLYISAPPDSSQPTADLDLYLLSGQRWNIAIAGQWVDDSIGTGPVEQVSAPADGQYWIAVQRYLDEESDPEAAATYGLTVQVPAGTIAREALAQGRLSSSQAVVPGKALVRLPVGPVAPPLAAQLELSELVDATDYRRVTLFRDAARKRDPRATAFAIKRLRRDPGVIHAEPVLRFTPQGVPVVDDPEFPHQWHLWPVDTLGGWEHSVLSAAETGGGALGEGVIVAVVDTGVAFDHPDFLRADGESQLLPGFDMIENVDTAVDGDGRDPYADDPGDQAGTGGGTFHGTHVAGIIAAATGNAVGIAGTAPDARILPVRAMGKGGGVLSDVVDAVLYAAGLPNGSGELPDRRADIINLSLAGSGRSQALADAVQQAIDAGVIVIAAAGNFARPAEEYTPAAEPGVVTVTALDASLRLARYSNFGTSDGVIDLTAMGGDLSVDRTLDARGDGVWSLLYRNQGDLLYGYIEGTSMAAAQVSGIAALMKGVWPQMGHTEFRALLPQAVIDIGDDGLDHDFGYGLLSAPLAVAAAARAAETPPVNSPVLHVSPRWFDFGRNYEVLPFEVINTGDAELVIEDIRSDVPWLRVDTQQTGPNRLLLDRWSPEVQWGLGEATLTIRSNAGEARLPVHLLRDESPATGDIGEVVVRLLRAEDDTVVQEVTTDAAADYGFAFESVEPGRYRVDASARLFSRKGTAGFVGELPFGEGVICVGVSHDTCSDVAFEDLIASMVFER